MQYRHVRPCYRIWQQTQALLIREDMLPPTPLLLIRGHILLREKNSLTYIVPDRGSAECTGSITTDQKNNPCTWPRPLKHYCGQPKLKTSCNSLSMLKNYQSPEKGSILYLGLRESASVNIPSELDASCSPHFSTWLIRMRQRAQCLGASEDELGVQKLVKLDAVHICDNGAWEAEKSACTGKEELMRATIETTKSQPNSLQPHYY